MLTVINTPRIFKFEHEGKKIELKDPNPDLSVTEVQKLFAGKYPQLTNATMSGPKMENDKAVYELSISIGTKG